MSTDPITRRKFVRDTTLAAAGMTVAASAAPPVQSTRSYNPNMEYRRLGQTGLMISAISLGGHWKQLPHAVGTKAFAKNRREVVSACIDCGVNYVDACCGPEILAYSEALRGRRDKMFLGFSHCEHEMRFSEWQTTARLLDALDDMMRQAKLDYVDFWRPTCYWQPDTNHTLAHEEALIGAFEAAKKAGKVRFFGMSTHKHDWAMRMIRTYPDWIQAIVLPYTAGSRKAHARVDKSPGGWQAVPEPPGGSMHSLIDVVAEHDVGWIGIKPFAGGSLFVSRGAVVPATKSEDDRRARLTLRYVLTNDSLTAAIPGLISPDQVHNAARAVRERRQLDLEETAELDRAVEQMWANLPRNYQWLKTEWQYV